MFKGGGRAKRVHAADAFFSTSEEKLHNQLQGHLMEVPKNYRFFILGCQRTGTTLMRLVLECHSKILCFGEVRGYQALTNNERTIPSGKQIVGFKIPRWTEQFGEA